MNEETKIREGYNDSAKLYLDSRTVEKGLNGLSNRELEQPAMYKLVPKNLKNKKVLDIGCGPGIHLKEYIRRGAEGYGIDISEEMIALAKKHCPKGNFTTGNIRKLKFADHSFDIITSSLALDHVPNLDEAASEIKRVLKKEGLFIFSAPHPTFNMFLGNKNKDLSINRSYFDKNIIYCNIVSNGKKFPDYPRAMDEYFRPFLEKGFILIDFSESRSKESWRKKHKDLKEIYYQVPRFAFFKWKK
ncbi:MAG: class I SAM-dependent methyltransferase [Candidatus Nanoarchaeia archaeon]